MRSFRYWFFFRLERLIQRGALFLLLLIALLITTVAFAGGMAAWFFTEAFASLPEAIWWAFLRLTDPGYLGDDEGLMLRFISTVVTVLGYVLFMGSLIAIMTQWLNQRIRVLESGLTPVRMENHVLILGWTNRTPEIVLELLLSLGRVKRFLKRLRIRSLRIVILTDHVDAGLVAELKEALGPQYEERQIILRTGVSLQREHLERVDFMRAAVIILPGADFTLGGSGANDMRVIKTILSLSHALQEVHATPPPLVAEVFDPHKIELARNSYAGDVHIVGGDSFLGRLMAQTVRHPGLSFIYGELLSYSDGNEIYVRSIPQWSGQPFFAIQGGFPRAIVLGVVRPTTASPGFIPYLNPDPLFTVEQDDRLIFLARNYDDTTPSKKRPPAAPPADRFIPIQSPPPPQRNLLILGWSHKLAALLEEFESYEQERFEIDILSRIGQEVRDLHLSVVLPNLHRVTVRHLRGDYNTGSLLQQHLTEKAYHNVIILSSDWLNAADSADARTLLGLLILERSLKEVSAEPKVLIELMDPDNAPLLTREQGEVLVSPVILSHILANVALRPELSEVYDELFGPGGAEFFFRPLAAYQLTPGPYSFADLQRHMPPYAEIPVGVRITAEQGERHGGVYLNPSSARRWSLQEADEIIVLTTYQ